MILAILLLVGSYLIGSIPVGVLVGRMFGFDPREVGSGNVGMTNVGRAGGSKAAAITFAGDILKGLVPVLIAAAVGADLGVMALAGLAAFFGSLFSVFLRFEGGKGVSTTLGVWLGLSPAVIVVCLIVFVIAFAARRIVSLSSLCAAVALPIAVVALGKGVGLSLIALIMGVTVVVRHRANIWRLMRGEEEPIRFGSRAAT